MSGPAPTQVKDRIITMCGRIEGITVSTEGWPEDRNAIPAADLPMALTQIILPANTQPIAGDRFSLTLTYQIALLAGRFDKNQTPRDVEKWGALEPFILLLISYFNQHRRLEDGDAGLAVKIVLPQLQAIDLTALDRALYPTAYFTMQVQTIHT